MREPRKFSVGEILRNEIRYVIPLYQRGYDWKGDAQVRDLFVDLISSIESPFSDNLFLGTMIFDVAEEKSGVIEVIDGQQRLTTLVITILAARDYARDVLNNEALSQLLQSHISNSDALTEVAHHRLQASESIADVLDLMSDYDWDRIFPSTIKKNGKNISVKRQVAKVKPIYEFCKQEIGSFAGGDVGSLKKFVKQLLHKTSIIKIEIEDQAEAFEIFERTNARGKSLEVADLLKNFLFSKQKEYSDDIAELWDELTEAFGSNILRALKYYWVSRKGSVTSRDLYRKIRYHAHEIGIPTFVEELREFSKYYNAYHTDDATVVKEWLLAQSFPQNDMYLNEFRRICSIFKLFGVTQVVPFIFSLVRAYTKGGGGEKEAKKVLSTLRTLESFHFVNTRLLGRFENKAEKVYAEFSEQLFHSKGLAPTVEIEEWFANEMGTEQELHAGLAALSYESRTDRLTIRYVFDKIANVGMKDGQRVDLVDIQSVEKGIKPSFDIEHLLSQAAGKKEEDSEYVHQIGNLIVIPRQINGILGDASFEAKMDMLRHPDRYSNNIKHVPSYLQDFVNCYGAGPWGKDEIVSRTAHLASAAYKAAKFQSAYK
jgi:hypothetical protein